jgi:hypothetical protein
MRRWYLFWPGCVFGSVTDEQPQGPTQPPCLPNPFANQIGKPAYASSRTSAVIAPAIIPLDCPREKDYCRAVPLRQSFVLA